MNNSQLVARSTWPVAVARLAPPPAIPALAHGVVDFSQGSTDSENQAQHGPGALARAGRALPVPAANSPAGRRLIRLPPRKALLQKQLAVRTPVRDSPRDKVAATRQKHIFQAAAIVLADQAIAGALNRNEFGPSPVVLYSLHARLQDSHQLGSTLDQLEDQLAELGRLTTRDEDSLRDADA